MLVKNLTGTLSKVNESDIRGFFSAFGEIESIDMDVDPATGRNRGQAIVHFSRSQDAQAAIQKMNGFIISDTPIVVTKLPYHLSHGFTQDFTDDTRHGLQSTHARAYLTSKLAGVAPDNELSQKYEEDHIEELERKVRKDQCWSRDETRVLGLFNLVDTQNLKDDDSTYLEDILEDVEGELNS